MNAKNRICLLCKGLLPLGLVLWMSGCATTAMKGTPFYSGEWEERSGPVEDRVNVWPFFYYREPAMSIMWPIFEKTPDHLAVRPVYSVRGLESDQKVHHVLWPIAKFDTHRNEHRIFPVFWADNEFVVFPLYWHFGKPFTGERGTNALFPLWIYHNRGPQNGVLHLGWPFARFERRENFSKNRVFPLFSHARFPNGNRFFYAIPFGYASMPAEEQSRGWLLPFALWKQSPDDRYVYSLPYSWREKDNETQRYALLMLWGHRSSETRDHHWLFPLYSFRREGPETRFISPLLYRHRDAEQSSWYTLLGGGTQRADGTRTVVTPLYMRFEVDAETDRMILPPLLTWRNREAGATRWQVLGPVARFSSGEREGDSWIFPFYYRNPGKNILITPAYQSGGTDDITWRSVFPLYYQRNTESSDLWITPLFAVSRKADGSGRTITPFYARVEDRPGEVTRIVPPLLSWRHETEAGTDNWLLGGLARWGGGADEKPSHVLPLYYRNTGTGTFLSLPYATWMRDDTQVRVIPPLLYSQTREADGERHDQWLFGIGSRRVDAEGQVKHAHLLPFYLRNREQRQLITPLYARWTRENDDRVQVVPPLLSWRRTEASGARQDRYALGLAGQTRDENGERQAAHLFPLFAYNHQHHHLFTPLYARWTRNQGQQMQLIPPALSWRITEPDGTQKDRALLGIAGKTVDAEGAVSQSHVLPFYHWRRNRHFFTPIFGRDEAETGTYRYWLTPLVGTYRNQVRGFWVTPLIRWHQDADTGHHDTRFLLWGRHVTSDRQRKTSWFPVFDRETAQDIREPRRNRHIVERDSFRFLLLYQQRMEQVRFRPGQGPRINQQRYRHLRESQNRLFPLWSFKTTAHGNRESVEDGPALSTGSVLWRLFDTRTETGTEAEPHEYVRRRVLWRLWHYERLNGDVSVDAFPFISHDRKTDGFKRTSFMWRVFRYENHPEEGRKLDILFIPLRRG